MTVSLRQTKKLLAGHKLVVTLWTRYVFEVSHSSPLQSLSSPRLKGDCSPFFLANNFQRIDTRQHVVGNSQPFGKRFAHRLSTVEASLGRYIGFGGAGIERRSIHSREQYQVAVRLKTGGQGHKHFALVEYVHVLVKHEGMLDIKEAAERHRRRRFALSFDGFAHLYINMRHAAARHRHMNSSHARYAALY